MSASTTAVMPHTYGIRYHFDLAKERERALIRAMNRRLCPNFDSAPQRYLEYSVKLGGKQCGAPQ